MWEDPERRDQVPLWRVSQRVAGAIDGCPGIVVSVDEQFATIIVKWDGHDFPVVYDFDSIMIRRTWPWE